MAKKKKVFRIYPALIAIVVGIFVLASAFFAYGTYKNKSLIQQQTHQTLGITAPTLNTTPISSPALSYNPKLDADPIEPCTSKNSGDSVNVKRSDCQNKYVDCQINNTWKVLSKEECSSLQTKTKEGTTPQITCLNGTYVNSFGNTVCRPEQSQTVPYGATAQCYDGTYSFSQHRQGTCSYHGGVYKWLYPSNTQSLDSPQQLPSNVNSNNVQLVTCVLSYGTYQLLPSDCDKDKQADQKNQQDYANQKLQRKQQCIDQINQLYDGMEKQNPSSVGLLEPDRQRYLANCNNH